MRAAGGFTWASLACLACASSGCGLDSAGQLQLSPGLDAATTGAPLDGAVDDDGPGVSPGDCTSLHGASMVPVGSTGGCIDSTEVTNADYAQFLSAIETGGLPGQPAWCQFKEGFVPGFDWPYASSDAQEPVVWVDWCDARLYCLWAGKRLCGGTGGGSNPVAGFADASQSQWFAACSAGGTRAYPYGANYDQAACFSQQPANTPPVAVATYPNCVGGYPGIHDMSGNAWEWEDSCEAYAGPSDLCLIRGGGMSATGTALACDSKVEVTRNDVTGDRGFRCCTP